MKFIVVTGGIASGKSSVVEIIKELGGEGLSIFDCDAALAELYQTGRLSRDLVTAFGSDALTDNGSVNKDFLRDLVKNDPEGRAKLEGLIHPKLMEMCREARDRAETEGRTHSFILDIPLYFESASTTRLPAEKVCVVASSRSCQIARCMKRDNCSESAAIAMMEAQMPTQEKIEQADIVFWNDGGLKELREQVACFYQSELAQGAAAMNKVPESINLNELRILPLKELQEIAAGHPTRGLGSLKRAELIYELCRYYLSRSCDVYVTGVIEHGKDNFAMLRDPARSFRPMEDDIYLSLELMRRYDLRVGNSVKVILRNHTKGKSDRYIAAADVIEIEGTAAADYTQKLHFDKLTPLFPRERLILENPRMKAPAMRVLDLITPLGKGQRALLVAPPRGGKTVLLKMMAKSLRLNYPDSELLILLLDERPEEVSDFEDTVDVTVYASTFDEPSRRHAQLSDLLIERARRLVEQGKDVIIMLDSLTRLSRGYNANQSGGRTMSGGLGSGALEKPRKFFGAARNVEEGGSLTIVATCLVDTESRMDDIIFEEFKGTGNMEIRLDRELSERRIYPAIAVQQSGTRNDDRLYHPDEMTRILQLRRQLASLPGWEGLETLLKNIRKTQNNAELLLKGISI